MRQSGFRENDSFVSGGFVSGHLMRLALLWGKTIMRLMIKTRENLLDLPSANFVPRLFGLGAWTAHLHFAYDLVAALRPQVLVELGTDRGESYFACCQSVTENRTDTRCFAVDTWRGDSQTGAYDETTFAEVSAHNRAHYSGFSTLIRARFDEALAQFAAESINVLHLDGLHTEAAVRDDLSAWLPKLAPGGTLLMHDVSVRGRDFGVWKVWEEMRERGRAYTFEQGPGLGVWQKPPSTPWPLPWEALLSGPGSIQENLARYYREQADATQRKIAQAWQDGTIRQTAIALQTTLQLFHSRDGTHSEDNSVGARIGHDEWKDVTLLLPAGAGAAPLRLDFYSAFTVIDLSLIRLTSGDETLFAAEDAAAFEQIVVAGDAKRLPHPTNLRVEITGMDPQLYLPAVEVSPDRTLSLTVRLRVHANEPPDR